MDRAHSSRPLHLFSAALGTSTMVRLWKETLEKPLLPSLQPFTPPSHPPLQQEEALWSLSGPADPRAVILGTNTNIQRAQRLGQNTGLGCVDAQVRGSYLAWRLSPCCSQRPCPPPWVKQSPWGVFRCLRGMKGWVVRQASSLWIHSPEPALPGFRWLPAQRSVHLVRCRECVYHPLGS